MNKPKILIVDDIRTNTLAMELMLRDVGADLFTAHSGNDALALSLKHKFSLVLLDVNMPEMDGYEVASFLSENEQTKEVPIIFVTAMDRAKENTLKGYESGAVDFIYKPIDNTILLSKVNIFLRLWSLRNTLEEELAYGKEKEKQILYLSEHDELTTLPNRRTLHNELEKTINLASRYTTNFALLFLDLDGFKIINDTLGHEAGDAFLTFISKEFRKKIRNFDFISRYGGDEFVIVLNHIDDKFTIMKKLEELIEAAVSVFHWKKHEISISVSIGVALYPEHGEDYHVLVKNADSAMYLAKNEGKNRFRFFSDELNQQVQRRSLIEKDMSRALINNEFDLHYQGLFDMSDKSIVGAEALIRWKHKDLGFISPEEFIAIAESNGMINEIGLWVLDKALELHQEYPQLRIAINVSSIQFRNQKLFERLKQYMHEGRLNPFKLELEITERLLIEDLHLEDHYMVKISELGFSCSIDDFGTGYSSLNQLKNCPISTLKIDKSFVFPLPSEQDGILCTTIIAMAKALGMDIVAEGIETEEQFTFLQSEGCHTAQGYYLARPMPKEDFVKLLESEEKF